MKSSSMFQLSWRLTRHSAICANLAAPPKCAVKHRSSKGGVALSDRGIVRRLATIVSLDVAGYSARTEADEPTSLAEIGQLRETIDDIVRTHTGRVFNSAGDGFMLEFASSVAALEAAFELADKCRPHVRVGVHLGDVAVQPNGDLLGHGVNIAARLMAQAGPGSVLVSAPVHQTVHPRLRERLSPRGLIKLDKMSEVIEAFSFASDATAPLTTRPSAHSPHSKPSLAVLPFANLSGDPDQNYFAEGMMEEVITALSRIRSIFVIGSGSSRSFMGQPIAAPDAARRMGVRFILEGSVRRSGPRIRISVKLTDATEDAQIWAERFDATLDDVFVLQDQVALSVAGVIEPTVLVAEERRAARRPLASLDGYDLYLRAAALRTTLHKAEVLEALALLDRALVLEPDFAPALGQAASCHSLVFVNNWSEDREMHRRQGLMMAERAISTGSDDAAVLAQTANALMELDNDLSRARALIERATTLNPGCAYAWFVGGVLSLAQNDGDAAAARFEEAARLDPLSPLGEMARVHIAMARIVQGDLVEAALIYRQTTYRTPRIHALMAAAYGMSGNVEEARRELALYAALTAVPPEVMVDRATGDAKLRAWMHEGLRRATKLPS